MKHAVMRLSLLLANWHSEHGAGLAVGLSSHGLRRQCWVVIDPTLCGAIKPTQRLMVPSGGVAATLHKQSQACPNPIIWKSNL